MLTVVAAAGSTRYTGVLRDTLVADHWLLLGPFPTGPREGITGAVDDPASLRPLPGDTFRSGLVQGGILRWQERTTDAQGWLTTNYDNTRWDCIQDYYGNAGLLNTGFAYTELECPQPCVALAVATRVSGFYLNGLPYVGDPYGYGWFQVPVPLDSGTNRVVLRLSGYGDERVRFMLVPPPGPLLTVAADATLPDVIADSAAQLWCGIPLLNCTDTPIDTAYLRCLLQEGIVAETTISNLPALGCLKPAVRMHIPALVHDSFPATVVVTASCRGFERHDTLRLRIRRPEEAHRVTFISRQDSSCQYYAVVYPSDFNRTRSYAAILSLHGAGVEASGLADCFKPKDWAFVVCPTNRRPFGFDWQDWGRLDALEVLDIVTSNLPIDADLVYLTGHSMGGHGTWHIGLHHADRFAAIAPAAGWPSMPLYVPWCLQRSAIFAAPGQLAMRDAVNRSDNPPALLENALNLPVFILHGGDDDNVPPLHGRNFAAWLQELGYQVTYKEVPGQRHWWSGPTGSACVDDTDLMGFLRTRRRNPGPRHIRFRTPDIGTSHRCYWVDIERVRTVGPDAVVEAWADTSVVRLRTSNVAQLRLDLDERVFFPGTIRVEVDGRLLNSRIDLPAQVHLHRTQRGWRMGAATAGRTTKSATRYGPARQAMMSPFVLVYGTSDTNLTYRLYQAATQEALRWWLTANGTAPVLADTEVTKAVIESHNLVLFGGAGQNTVTRRIADRLPVRITSGRMQLAGTDLGDSLAVMLVYPNPLNPERLVLVRMGTDSAATRLSLLWGVIGSCTGIPDFLVFDRTVRRYGWTGVRAAGFLGPNWQLDPASTWQR